MLSLDNTPLTRERTRQRLNSLYEQWVKLSDQEWEIDAMSTPYYTDDLLNYWGIERREVTDKEVDELVLKLDVVNEQFDKTATELKAMYDEVEENKPTT